MDEIARVVSPRRPISLGTHILCHKRSTLMGSSPTSSGAKRQIVPRQMSPPLPRPMPATPNSLTATGNGLLHYEPRYDRCRCSGLWPRTRHAVLRNFLTYNRTEKDLRPQFALYGAAFSSALISSTWKPGSGVWQKGSYGMLTQAGFGVLSNWVGEFAPEIRRVLSRNPKN